MTTDFIRFGAMLYEYSRDVIEAKISATAMRTYSRNLSNERKIHRIVTHIAWYLSPDTNRTWFRTGPNVFSARVGAINIILQDSTVNHSDRSKHESKPDSEDRLQHDASSAQTRIDYYVH